MIAALFVETNGVYFGLENVDPWDINRDARNYKGPHPVVAHPPCQRWTNFAFLNYNRYGGEHNRPFNDAGCFESALQSVNTFGGVLEHPAYSHAWKMFNLVRPEKGMWTQSGNGWTCEIWQSSYGHRARKATWLYFVGLKKPEPMIWDRIQGTHQVGWFDRIKPSLSKREAAATPIDFRNALISIAKNASEY